jgi:hypothetical protein
MIGAGDHGIETGFAYCLDNSGVIRGHDCPRNCGRGGRAFSHPHDQGFFADFQHRLPGKTH